MGIETDDGSVAATIGRIVWYCNESGHYSLPAIVNCTRESWVRTGRDGPSQVPRPAEGCVHITVFSPGSSYIELDVPEGDGPRHWRWPDRSR